MFSVKRLAEHLGCEPDQAKEVRRILDASFVRGQRTEWESDSPSYEIDHDSPSRKLYAIDRALKHTGFCGVEIVRSTDDSMTQFRGLSYLNKGDTYRATLLYDHARAKWILSDLGTLIERSPSRFE